MSSKIIVPFDDQEGGTYELKIDLDRLSKDGMLSAIRGMGHTSKKKQHSTFVENDPGRSPEEIFGDVKGMNWGHLFSNMPSPQDVPDKKSNWEEGLNDLYNTKSLHHARSSNPFIPSLNKIGPSAIENAKLSWFKDEVKKVKSVGELKKTVEQGLNAGIRTNACHEGQQSFADAVILKMLSISCTKDEKKDMIGKLLLKGAFFRYDLLQNKEISEVYNKLYREVQLQIDKRLKKLEEISKNAVQEGSLEDVGIDNRTFFIKFSEGSKVEPAKVLETTRNLGLNKGLGGHIIKIGNNEIEVKVEEGGERNYTGLSDGGDLTMMLHSDFGEVKIRLRHDTENYDRVQVIVEDKETWEKLQKEGGAIKENCLLGGRTVKEAIKEGGFKRSGMLSKEQAIEEIKEVSKSETLSWVNRIHEGSRATSMKR